MDDDITIGFVLGFCLTLATVNIVWLIGDIAWADARNRMMSQCVERHTYESCLAVWNNKMREPVLVLKDVAS